VFFIRSSAALDTQGLANHPLEWADISGGCPKLELCIPRRSRLQQRVLSSIAEAHARNRLRMTAVEAFGQSQDCRQGTNHAAAFPA
jgi:hypothetical protein